MIQLHQHSSMHTFPGGVTYNFETIIWHAIEGNTHMFVKEIFQSNNEDYKMGNSYAGQLKTTRFEEVLHNSIEASLRSNNLVPRPVFSQLYLEAEHQLISNLEACKRPGNEEEEEDDGSETSSPLIPYQMKPPPEGCCTTDGFCQAGKDLRLVSMSNEQIEVPSGFLLIGAKSPNLPEHLLVCAVDKRFLPDDNGRNALLGFSGNCVGCGEKGFRYFTEFSNHINLKLITQPKKQKHLKCYLIKNAQGSLTKGPLICWKGTEGRTQQSSSSSTSSIPSQPPESPASSTTVASAESISGTNHNALTGFQQAGAPTDHTLSRAATGVSAAHNNRDSSRHQNPMKPNNVSCQNMSRPSVIGNLANSGPPKKRHRGWSPDASSATETSSIQSNPLAPNSGSKAVADTVELACMTQSSLLGPIPSPLTTSEEPVVVPDNLLKICRTRPVIFKGHGNLPYLCGNLNDIVVSPLLQNCYRNTQSFPRVYEQHGTSVTTVLSIEMQVLLTVYYLAQLAPDQVPLIEDLELILVRAWQESNLTETKQYQQAVSQSVPYASSPTLTVTATQLTWLAKLAASSCKNVVRILDSSSTLVEGLTETFKLLSEGKLQGKNFVVIICTTKNQSTESCVVVTGKRQAGFLAERMLSPKEHLKEINYELVTGKVGALGAFFSSLCPEGDIDALLEKCGLAKNGQGSSVTASLNKCDDTTLQRPTICSVSNKESCQIHPVQLAVARKLLSHVCAIADSSTQNLDLGSFEKVDFLILIPPSEVAYQQTVLRVRQSGILVELGLEAESTANQYAEQYVMKLTTEAQSKFEAFQQRALKNPYTLFILIHDHAHWDLTSGGAFPHSEPFLGLADRIVNCKEMKEALNVLTLQVTSFPFALQTQQTYISPYNEIHWPSPCNNGMNLYHENNKYFGLSDFIDSTYSGHKLPLLRYDSSFEAMVTAVEERFPKMHSAVIWTYILIQHYSAAMMVTAGHLQMKNYSSVETLEIIQSLTNSTGSCPSSHGYMVLLRIPSISLAALAYERLCQVRYRLGLQHRFEIILGMPNTKINISQHFLTQLKVWQKIEDPNWTPLTYMDLEDLPCILILSGTDPYGESFPRSAKYYDLRLINSTCLLRTALEQELGLAACYVVLDVPRQTVIVNDLSESDLDKPGSTDDDEVSVSIEVTAVADLGKKSNNKRQRSYSNHSASSRSSKTSSLLCDSDPFSTSGAEDSARHPPNVESVNIEDGSIAREKPKLRADNMQQKPMNETQYSEKHRINLDQIDNRRSSRRSTKTFSSNSSSAQTPILGQVTSQCPRTKAASQPPTVFLPKLIYEIVTKVDSAGVGKLSSFLPHHTVQWITSFHPSLAKMMTSTEQSLYYRQWTVTKRNHMDFNKTQNRTEMFHPRRLLLNGPPQVGKTGAYLQFLSILSRMLIRLMEVDVYDEEEINLKTKEDSALQQKESLLWPDLESFSTLLFDYTVHDPKYEDASPVYSRDLAKNKGYKANKKEDDIYLRRHTTRMRLSKYAACNTYHHCEQCHEYMGFSPRCQPYDSTLHAFTFSCSILGEEVQLHFIIPKSKEHNFIFSQPAGQLESMRLPLVTDKNPDCIKSPVFTPTTGRHEHGLFNLYHAMDGASHLHVLVIKEYEMAVYKKYWPNHIMLVLPSIFNNSGVGAAHFLIKELSYHNLELERNRQEELGSKPQDVWPFIVIADDSCVMWNSLNTEVSQNSTSVPAEQNVLERNVSLKHVLQHIEATAQIPHYALCGVRKWSSKVHSPYLTEPFSRCHLHDFLLLNVDLTQNVQYNQNRFTCDDVDFNIRVHSAGLLICRFNRFSVMKKQIAIGGHRTFLIKSKVPDVPMSISPSQYICAPDSKHTFLAAPAQLLLEKYLQHTSNHLFPLSVRNYNHPVLSVDCYLNLGQEITVCFVSSRPHSLNINTSGLAFSGLLLYLCDSFVTSSILRRFHFLKGATLCVICQDRSSLRQTVVRLELEDEWQFRLRDEFQTANSQEDKPLFFLTGRHV